MANPDVAAIIGTNADCYILGEEAKKAGRKDIITLGFDLNEGTERLMKEGYFSVILDQATERPGLHGAGQPVRISALSEGD